ncbi:MAG: HAD family hydrolase [Parahaliea sp.]
MTLAIFDLDNTLIAGDSDHLWGCYICEQGIVKHERYHQQNEQFYRDYQQGKLDVDAYLRFALAPLANQNADTLQRWHQGFMNTKIKPIMLPAAQTLVDSHRAKKHQLLIITATNEFITRPIATALGIDELLACEGEQINGRYTGNPKGIPSFAEGKVARLQQWCETRGENMTDAWFYSDSHNDLPLLSQVDNPVAVDPDNTLRAHAKEAGWPIISLR